MKKRFLNIVFLVAVFAFLLGGCDQKNRSEQLEIPEVKETIAFNALEDQLFSYFSLEMNQEEFKENLQVGSKFTMTPCFDFPDTIEIVGLKFEVVVPESIEELKETSYQFNFEPSSSGKVAPITFTLANSWDKHQIRFTNIQAVTQEGTVYTVEDEEVKIISQSKQQYHIQYKVDDKADHYAYYINDDKNNSANSINTPFYYPFEPSESYVQFANQFYT